MAATYWFSTRSALLAQDPAWEEVAPYVEPLHRLIARRYPWVTGHDREDLVQELLLEIKGTLAARHDPSRGKFRSLLAAVVHRRLVDRLRKRRPEALPGELEAAPPQELIELDLEASLQHAFARCRDGLTQGPEKDHDALYALIDRVLHGRSNVEIAAASGVSPHAVARRLRRARGLLFGALLERELGLRADDPRQPGAVEALSHALREPRRAAAAGLEPGLAEATLELARRLRASWSTVSDADALRRGLALVLEAD